LLFQNIYKIRKGIIMIEATIPKRVQSFNQFKGRQWYKYYNYKMQWFRYLRYFFPQQERNTSHVYLEIVAYHTKKQEFYDYDNLVGGCKPILDSLKTLGYIADDSTKWVTVIYSQDIADDYQTKIVLKHESEVVIKIPFKVWSRFLREDWQDDLSKIPKDHSLNALIQSPNKDMEYHIKLIEPYDESLEQNYKKWKTSLNHDFDHKFWPIMQRYFDDVLNELELKKKC